MKNGNTGETVMAGNQFAVYQLREIPENRKKRFRSYAELQKEHIQIISETVWQSSYRKIFLDMP